MIKKLLNKEKEYAKVSVNKNFKNKSVDDKFWIKCTSCGSNIFKKEVEENLNICPKCNYHFKLPARERVNLLIDEGTFVEIDADLTSINILDFPEYEEKLSKYSAKSKEKEAVITGYGKINDIEVALCVMNPDFMMGSMGFIVGEKITKGIEYAIENKLPIIIVCASGGARMQEGIISLMQMAKTSQALKKLSENNLPYISILTDPTTGGVTASFAMLGDLIISEPNALIGFAGPRVIKQTIKQDLPEGFQRSEFLLDHGFVDLIVNRKDMKNKLYKILKIHGC
ncbi:acetyl-CoA carboxylase, carboxyltransferase subunit beta [Tepidibacter formicigenes]|jgi:acetyl-CoA carboxylase carboxyl transferase subunit beta|uniref:Acetyl-coenzyme A carboxylase carboxyl transferase subunit beta n=1 Tax=Tepidibacter formicigenes DSM 15518 TaxID=1123349 RepID=A0A1M6MAH6_9FIRM|nr:acetyl-CoA carboxylase, carboxyltransferase subunit beta [Tepidibacter formicigenes]SHJ80498.1 acetyl-CoA carboxylase carboxyl transferase subunit beta [Tepidibacter formicigenes DSM 15518]